MNDPYRRIAGSYDRLFENMNKGLRLAGMRMFRPAKGMDILDVGCGTGAHLALYQRYECDLYGIDISPSMLAVARARLGAARLALGNATSMPYADRQFDLIISMLSLHEMAPTMRSGVLAEMKRVLKRGGRMLLTDFHAGPYRPLRGWISKFVIVCSELAAGGEHFRNYRQFMASKGLPSLMAQHHLGVEQQTILAGGTFAICLVTSTD